ncbi:hypothetical protein BCR33DRAFT_318789 [Rhizoclosmatium globosum]|uniref:L domain-like protein n=1 Tax=Rhizoclosmatium globosum TaxID=329046 RepID=A0A1Y2CZV5_9FUNG|nr:hypothetical protein BCR33DRAFT_318789 [Rhizoclosmatium globosum]|eukprot:ORY52487.1 hypothetical protein BCR33DRAFT_318789 [Rhizoclosmatium globosum]
MTLFPSAAILVVISVSALAQNTSTNADCVIATKIWPVVFPPNVNCCDTANINCNGAKYSKPATDADDCYIKCNSNGSIDTIKLANSALQPGPIPDFSQLTGLTHLYLPNNRFTGVIGSFPVNLIIFYAGDNQLTGVIPSFPNKLTYFDVGSNKLSGPIPPFSESFIVL